MGRARPEASGSPSCMRTHLRPVTHFFSLPSTSTGATRNSNWMPSSSAWWISSARAGHFLAGAAIDDHGRLRAEALGGAGGVHGNVAAADGGDALAVEHGVSARGNW